MFPHFSDAPIRAGHSHPCQSAERVTAVIAHTLPERNASNRVLEKAGFQFEAEAQEDGEVVWRFSRTRPASGG